MVDPTVWVPKAMGKKPAATPAADPLDDPPGVCRTLRGFRVGARFETANSVVTVLPATIAPARLNAVTQLASGPSNRFAGKFEPQRVGNPSAFITSLTPRSDPNRGGRLDGSGCFSRSSSYWFRIRSASSVPGTNAPILSSSASIRLQITSIRVLGSVASLVNGFHQA